MGLISDVEGAKRRPGEVETPEDIVTQKGYAHLFRVSYLYSYLE
jgi:hypothetical protein